MHKKATFYNHGRISVSSGWIKAAGRIHRLAAKRWIKRATRIHQSAETIHWWKRYAYSAHIKLMRFLRYHILHLVPVRPAQDKKAREE